MFGKEKNNFSKPAVFLLAIVIISAALFITIKSLFSERSSRMIADYNGKHPFFEKEGESKLFYSSLSPSTRSDSISVLLKANEGISSSTRNSASSKMQEELPSATNDTSTSVLSDFEKQAIAQLGEPESPPPQAGSGKAIEKSIERQAEQQNMSNMGGKPGRHSSQSSLSGKKSAFTSRLSSINNFNNLRIGKNFKSQGDSGNVSQSFGQNSNGAYSNSDFGSSGYSGANSSMGSQANSGSYSSSDTNAASSAAGRNDANKPKQDIPRPQMLVYKQVYDFGNVNLYEYSKRLVTVMNVGKKDLRIGRINKLNEEDNSFYLAMDNCSNKTLKPAAECTFQIVFRPYHSGLAADGFEIESNDADKIPYSNYIEVSGRAASYYYSYLWLYRYQATTKMDFGTVTAGHSLELTYLFRNNIADRLEGLHFVRESGTNASFSVSYTNCPNDEMYFGQYCLVKIRFSPVDNLLKYISPDYGKYYAVNGYNGDKRLMYNPTYPPDVIDKPFEIELTGSIKALARIDGAANMNVVRTIPLRAFSSARYPNPSLKRVAEENLYSF